MPHASDAKGIFRQNLIDAGCGPELVRQCTDLIAQKEHAELMRILSLHRKTLLDTVHQNEERIDCLDYLLHDLGKQNHENNTGGIVTWKKNWF